MESRTRLAVSGAAVFTASVAVVASVAITNAVAFADAPGSAIDAEALSVPGAVRTAEPAPVVTPVATPTAIAEPVPEPTTKTVTVPAPKPVVVAPAVETPTEAEEDDVVTEVAGSGSWDAAYKWAQEHGWSKERVDRWIALLKVKVAEFESDSQYSGDKTRHRPPAPDSSGSPSPPEATTPGGG